MYTFVFNKNVADYVWCREGNIPYCRRAFPSQIQTLSLCFVVFISCPGSVCSVQMLQKIT